jgi:hypothetical protein
MSHVSDSLYTFRVLIRRFIVLSMFVVLAPLGVAACTAEGPGTKTDCNVGGCTVTFTRGVNATASILGVNAELVAVNANTVTLNVGGQQITVPVGGTQPANGFNVTVQEITKETVVVKVSTGVTGG